MPFWGWVLLIAGLSLLLLLSVAAIVRGTHKLPKHEPLQGDPEDIASPIPHHLAVADDEMTAREIEQERARERGPAEVTRNS